MSTILRYAAGLLAVVFAAVLIAPAAFGDRLKLKDGTVLEGTVIARGDGYWIKTADGSTQTIPKAQVASPERGNAPAAAPTPAPGAAASPAKPGSATPAGTPAGTPAAAPKPGSNLSFAATRAKANMVDTALAAVTIWQQFVDNNPTSPDLPAAKQELAKWKELADHGGEKIKGKWIGGDERQAIVDKAVALRKEAETLIQSNQTLQAVKKLEESANIYPNSFETNFILGYLAAIQDNENKAMEWFNQALRVQPDCPEVLANIGVLHLLKKPQPQYEKGISLLRKALEIGDRKEIAQDLVNVCFNIPPQMQNNKQIKESTEVAKLMMAKYGIGPERALFYIPLRPRDQMAKKGGKGPNGPKGDDSEDHGNSGPAGMWSGTGFLIAADGLILTNRHVVDGGKTLLVVMQDRTQKSAEVVVIDDTQDLALIRIKTDGKQLPFVKLAPADSPADGAECTVMGYPLIDRLGASIKITRGIVSSAGADRKLTGPDVLIDAKVNPGNSGGPILDKYGNVMAIVSMKTVASALEDTYGLGISAGHIRKFLAKNKIAVGTAKDGTASLSAEQIAAQVKPAAVCILATR